LHSDGTPPWAFRNDITNKFSDCDIFKVRHVDIVWELFHWKFGGHKTIEGKQRRIVA
jgi:hypothetical protein